MSDADFDLVPQNAPVFAQEAVETIKRIEKVMLDYSPKSLKVIDNILGRFHEEGSEADDMPSTVINFGCYVGEVFVRNVGAKWRMVSQKEVNEIYGVPLILQLDRETTANPIGKVIKRINFGEEDNIPYFYKAFTRDLKK